MIRGFLWTCPAISVLSIRWQVNANSCLRIIHSPRGETETITASCDSSQIVQSNPLSVRSLGEEGGSPVFTKNIPVTHFHHNPLVSMFPVKTMTETTHRSGAQISFYLFILSLSYVSSRIILKAHILSSKIKWGFSQDFRLILYLFTPQTDFTSGPKPPVAPWNL